MAKDITKQRRAEEALRESEAKFRALAESSSAAIFLIQGNKYLYINPAFTAMTGYATEDLVSMNFWDFISPDMRELVKARGIGRQRGEDLPPRYDLKFMTKSGDERFGDFGATLIEFQGKPTIFGSVIDITGRKRMEEALRESEEKFRLSFENANTGMCLVDMSGNLMRVNDRMCAIFGYTKQELENMTVNNIAVSEDANLSPEFINKATAGEMDRAVFEKRYYHKDGHVVWGLVSSSLVRDSKGRACYFISQVQDITERKQTEAALRSREEEASRLARENTIVAEIGKIISSTLNIDEAYASFSAKVRTLLPCDRIVINLVNKDNLTLVNRYVEGDPAPERNAGDTFPIAGTLTGMVMQDREGSILDSQDEAEIAATCPALLPEWEAGFRSFLSVPLISGDKAIGGLHLRSKGYRSYSEKDLRLVENIANQIAGAIANAQLFAERERAEEVLRSSEEKYRNLVESIPEAILIRHRGIIEYANPAAVELFGASSDVDLIGRPNLDLIYSDDRAESVERIKQNQEGLKVPLREHRILTLDGRVVHVESIGVPFAHGGRLLAYGMLRDITKRKRAEQELRESEGEARRLAQENVIIAEIGRIVSSTLNISEVYERFAEQVRRLISFDRISINLIDHEARRATVAHISGTRVKGRQIGDVFPLEGTVTDKIIGTRSGVLLHPQDQAELERRFPRLIPSFQAGHRSMMVVPLISKDRVIASVYLGSRRSNSFSDRDLKLAELIGAQIAGAIANAQLFTERKQMEEALRKSEERFRDLYDHAPLGYHEYDAEGRITSVNRTDLEMLGYAAEEMIGQYIWKFNVEEETVRQQILAKLGGSLPPARNLERTYRRKDGTTFPVLCEDLLILDEKGRIKGIRATVQDITERKKGEEDRRRLEERLSRAEKMEALGTLAGGVAHDLNNVLGVLVGYSELLLMEIPQGSPLRRHVSNILQSGQRAAAIIQDLLTLARRGVAVSEVVNLNGVISDYFETPEFEKLKAYHPRVTFRTELDRDLMNIKGSPVHLSKTIMNLLSNAAEAITDHGEVRILTENRYLDRPITGYDHIQEGDYVVLRVSDDGKGISRRDMGKIFEPFYTKKGMGRSGTGLGLAVVWGTVKDHQGYIDVQSEERKGSIFTLYFPVTREERMREEEVISPESYRGRGESIWGVDDVKEQRELATAMLSGLGYRVGSVSSGEEAVAYLKSHEVALLVLDMIMDPGMDGLETYQKVLEISPKQKAVIVSGFSETDRVKKAQELGAGAYVRKPYIREKIGLAIRKELDG